MSDRTFTSDLGEGVATTGITLTGFLLGAVVGASIALLLAPAAGGETRRKVAETAKKIGSKAGDFVNRSRLGDSEEESSEETNQATGGVRKTGGAGEPYRSGGRREPLSGGRTPQPGTPGTAS